MSATRLKRFVGLTFAKCRDCGESAINGYWVESPRGSYALCLGCVYAISSAVNSTSDFVAPVAPLSETPSAIHGVMWLLIRDGAVLLERCEKKARVLGVGEWFVPGGKIEGDETPEQALRREIAEEWPGAELLAWSPLPILEGSPVPPGPKGLFLMRPYVVNVSFAKAADGCAPAETSEGTPLRWFPVADALASPVPQVRMMLAAAFSASPQVPVASDTEQNDRE